MVHCAEAGEEMLGEKYFKDQIRELRGASCRFRLWWGDFCYIPTLVDRPGAQVYRILEMGTPDHHK